MMPAARLAPRIGLVALGLLLALCACELLLRLLAPGDDGFYPWPPGLRRVFRPLPGVMPGVEGESRFAVNSLGLRGREPPPDPDLALLAIGGSTTECLYLDQAEAWPGRLEGLLAGGVGDEVWVANAGMSGRNTRDHVLLLEHLPGLERFDVVVILAGVNDLLLRLGQGEAYDPGFLDGAAGRRHHLRRAFEVLPRGLGAERPFPKDTALWRTLVPGLRRLLAPDRVQDEAGAVYLTWRAHRRGAARILSELPDLAPSLAEYRRNLTRMVELGLASGARVLLVTQPFLWSADMPAEAEDLLWMGGVGAYQEESGAAYYAPSALAEGMERYNAALLEIGRERGVSVLDLAALLPRETSVFYDGVHFNENGARLAAEHVAAALR